MTFTSSSSWFYFSLLSIISLAFAEFAQKIALTHKADISAITNNFYVWILQGIGGIILAVGLGETFDYSGFPFFKLLILALFYFAGGTFYYTSFKSNSPSISIILLSISVVISSTLGIIFFNESTEPVKFAGIFLILLSIILINYKKGIKLKAGNLYALIGGVCFGVAYTLDKSFVLNIPAGVYLFLMSFSVAGVSLLLKAVHILKESKRLGFENYKRMLASAVFGVLFNYFTFSSYKLGGNVGVVDALNNAAVFIVIVLEIFILKDRSDLIKKFGISVIAVLGIYLLSGVK